MTPDALSVTSQITSQIIEARDFSAGSLITEHLLRSIVFHVITHPQQFVWSYQGLGMLRTYFGQHLRLHIWCPSRAVPGVSVFHTHPWDFTSYVVSGDLTNNLFVESALDVPGSQRFKRQAIRCGRGGGLCQDNSAQEIFIKRVAQNCYLPGQFYQEEASAIHFTTAQEGTVTLVSRSFKPDTEHAHVFWPAEEEWVSAEPRPATPEEIEYFTKAAEAEFASNTDGGLRGEA